MTAAIAARRLAGRPWPPGVAVPPLSPRLQLARGALLTLFVISMSLILELVVLGGVQQRAAQQRAFDALRAELAEGTAPISPVDANGRLLAAGTPIAYLEIPAIGVRQVVVEGTSGSNLFTGPGHRRDSPFPGQVGTSILLGRRAAFGGPFARLDELERGDLIRVTTGAGAFDYRVVGLREEGDPVPEPARAGDGRLLLATADGRPFMPAGVLRVDAELDVPALVGSPPPIASTALPGAEQPMGSDTSTLWALALWLQALIVVTGGAVWAWHRWGRAEAWVVALPVLLLVGLHTAGEAARLIPNLL